MRGKERAGNKDCIIWKTGYEGINKLSHANDTTIRFSDTIYQRLTRHSYKHT